MPVPLIIFMRVLLAGVILFLYCRYKRFDLSIRKEDLRTILLGGIFLGIHWVTYFYALKLSNVAIALLSLYTFPAMTAILDPVFNKSRLEGIHLLLGVMILFGIYLLVPYFSFQSNYFIAVCFGLVSALSYAIRNILIKPKTKHYNQSVLMFSQLLVITVALLPVLFFFNTTGVIEYFPATLTLALLTTAIGHTLFIQSLNYFSTTSASLMSSMSPVYGILLAAIFLDEYPNLITVLGGFVIVSTVVIEALRVKNVDKKSKN